MRAERASKPRNEGTQPDHSKSCPDTEIPLVDKAILGSVVSVVGSRFLSMTSTTETGSADEMSALEVRETLLEAAAERRQADRSEARLLALAVQIVHLHPVDDKTCTATWNPSASLDEEPEPVAGTGTPLVAERAVEELGAALDISYHSALGLVSDSLELRYRLPRLWALVQDGKLQAWKARKVAQQTTHLGAEAVAFVDAQAAIAGGKNRITANLAGLVHEALIRLEPEKARAREEAAQQRREVQFDFSGDEIDGVGSAILYARMDLVDGLDLDGAVTDLADHLGRLGDDSPLDERRARALGLLAHPQQVLDLAGAEPSQPDSSTTTKTPTGTRTGLAQWATTSTRISTTAAATIYLHLDAEDLRRHTQDGDLTPGTVEKLGVASLQVIATWLQRTRGITIKPVLEMNRADAVDAHDPPAWMRDLVILRDGHCVFPGCTIDARRCDQDHIEPYIPIDQGGPPGQTSPANLACLCRRHHRLKTFTGWDYQRTRPGTYAWTNPHGLTYESRPTPKH